MNTNLQTMLERIMQDFNKSIQNSMQSVMAQMERMQMQQFSTMEKLTQRAFFSNNPTTTSTQQPHSTGYNINSSNVVNIAHDKMQITNESKAALEIGKVDSSVSQGDMEQ